MRSSPPRHPDEPRAEFSALEGVIQEATDLAVGDRVVYPNQGVCSVVGVEVKEIAGQKLELIRLRREEDGAAVMVPRNKVQSVGLRRVASGELMEGVFHYLAAQYDDPELDWKVRHRDNADRMVAGGVLGIAEVVKGLHALSRLRPLPTKEREQYDGARHLLVAEVAVSLGVPPAVAEDYIDFALMPPAGTKFNLKPPPKPVLMPSRPKRKRIVADDEGDGLEGLGLEELGIDLGEEAGAVATIEGAAEASGEGASEGEGEASPVAADETSPAADDAGDTGDDAGDDEAPTPAARPTAKKAKAVFAKAAPAKAAPTKAAPAKAAKKPAPKPAPAKKAAAKPAQARVAAKKPATKKAGGKKK